MTNPVRPVAEKGLFDKIKVGKTEYEYRQTLTIPLASQFYDLLQLVKLEFFEANLIFDIEGLTIDIMNPSNVSRGILKIKKDFFREYNFNRGTHGINLDNISKVLSGFNEGGPVKLYYASGVFKLVFIQKTDKSQRIFIIPLIEIDKKEEKPITKKTGVILNTPIKHLQEFFDANFKRNISEVLLLNTKKPNSIVFTIISREGEDAASFKEKKLTKELILGKETQGEIKEDILNKYSFMKIKDILHKAEKIFSTVELATGKNDLLSLFFQSEKYSYQWYLAPMSDSK